jgi:hypothetical protein
MSSISVSMYGKNRGRNYLFRILSRKTLSKQCTDCPGVLKKWCQYMSNISVSIYGKNRGRNYLFRILSWKTLSKQCTDCPGVLKNGVSICLTYQCQFMVKIETAITCSEFCHKKHCLKNAQTLLGYSKNGVRMCLTYQCQFKARVMLVALLAHHLPTLMSFNSPLWTNMGLFCRTVNVILWDCVSTEMRQTSITKKEGRTVA